MLQRGFIKPEDEEPQIHGFEFYLDAFAELSTSRPTGLDLQAIPFTAIAEYFRIYELDDFDDFAYVIRRMDNTFMRLNAGASEGKKKDGNTDPNKKNSNKG